MINKYRKKPITIEAIQFTRDNIDEIYDFSRGKVFNFVIPNTFDRTATCCIETLEGIMKAQEGDYIIKGVEDEIYSCEKNIFEKTYEKVLT